MNGTLGAHTFVLNKTQRMKASVSNRYGAPEVFRLEDVAKPSPKPNEVLVKIHATTVTGSDLMMRKGKPYVGRLYLGLRKPNVSILGFDFAGEVVHIGEQVTSLKVGDQVFGGTTALGCYAEYTCVNAEDVITTMPTNISYREAAPVSGSGITVMHFLKGLAQIKAGDKLLINGASGSLGTYAVQIAKHLGAEVTGVCSTTNIEMVKALGADFVIDYTRTDFTQHGKQYDVIFDTVGKITFAQCKKALTPNGRYLSSVISLPLLLQIIKTAWFGHQRALSASTGMLPAKERLKYFLELKELLQAGQIKTVIDRTYPLSQMADAHEYVEKGHKKGNVIIDVSPHPTAS